MRKRIRKFLPDHEAIRGNPWLARFETTLLHPRLWDLNRHSAAGGVAAGMFCGLIPGPLQMLGAGLVAVLFRINLPVALLTTLYTNPLTIVPLYLLAYKLGAFVLGATGGVVPAPPPDWVWNQPVASAQAMSAWMVGLGAPLALGVFLLACGLAVAGYVIVRVLWSAWLRRQWHRRRLRPRIGA